MTGARDKRKRMDWVGVTMKNEGYQMAQKSDGKFLVGDVWDGGTWICLVYSYRNGRIICSVCSVTSGV
jgi:hypothetical protein